MLLSVWWQNGGCSLDFTLKNNCAVGSSLKKSGRYCGWEPEQKLTVSHSYQKEKGKWKRRVGKSMRFWTLECCGKFWFRRELWWRTATNSYCAEFHPAQCNIGIVQSRNPGNALNFYPCFLQNWGHWWLELTFFTHSSEL